MVKPMRYLFLFYIFFLASFSYSQEPNCPNKSISSSHCSTLLTSADSNPALENSYHYCRTSETKPTLKDFCRVPRCPSTYINDPTNPIKCICPPQQIEYEVDEISGQKKCGPICTSPEVINFSSDGLSCVIPASPPGEGEECVPFMPCNEECPSGKTKQGTINGSAVCVGSCEGGGSWGAVNGVEGCYGDDPTCPTGQTYGSVNGTSGCWDNSGCDDLGTCSGGGSSSGDGSGSGGSGGGSGGGDGSGGDGGGDGGGDDGTGGGAGGGGGGGGNNNGIGADYPDLVDCPQNFVKEGTKCVAEDGRGDCPVGYHRLVLSADPFLSICVPDNPPPASSSSASSQPASSRSSSSQASHSAASQSNMSSGSNTSSGGTGGGSGGGSGGDGEGSGACDPTSVDYIKCASGASTALEIPEERGRFDSQISERRIEDLEQELLQQVQSIKDEISNELSLNLNTGASLSDECFTVYGRQVCIGFARWSSYLGTIGDAIMVIAAFLSFGIVMRKN